MAKKVISRHRAAAKFGWLGAIIALGFTLFWPSIYPTTIIVNSASAMWLPSSSTTSFAWQKANKTLLISSY